MQSISFNITTAVVDAINAADLDIQAVRVSRKFRPGTDYADDGGRAQLTIVPRDIVYAALDRAANKVVVSIDINIENCSYHDNLAERLADIFRLKRLDTFVAARCTRVFISLTESRVTLTFELVK